MALPALGESIELLGLLACYSAPAPLFMPDGTLNPDLPRYLSEASTLNALWLKVSLGHFSDKQQLEALRVLLDESGMTLVVENDQTDCGQLAPMQRFKAACRVMALPDVRYGQLAVGWRLPGRGCTSVGSRRELHSCEGRGPA